MLGMTPRQMIWSIVVLVWVNMLPYLSRLPKGLGWVAQYLPDEGHMLLGLIFFHIFYSTPAIPLIKSLRNKEKPDLIWAIALIAITILTWAVHKDHDLASDAQAATVLVITPLITMGAAYAILAARQFLINLVPITRYLVLTALAIIALIVYTYQNFGDAHYQKLNATIQRIAVMDDKGINNFLDLHEHRNNRYAIAAAARNPKTSSETLYRIVFIDDPELHESVFAKREKTLNGGSDSVMRIVSKHPNASSEVLAHLALSPNPGVLWEVAGNIKTPMSSLENIYNQRVKICEDYKEKTKTEVTWMIDRIENGIASNAVAPERILREIGNNSQDGYVLISLKNNSGAPRDVRESAATRITNKDYYEYQRMKIKP